MKRTDLVIGYEAGDAQFYTKESVDAEIGLLHNEISRLFGANTRVERDNKLLADALCEISEKEFANSGYNLPQMIRLIAELTASKQRYGIAIEYSASLESELTRYRQAEAERAERVQAACNEVLPE